VQYVTQNLKLNVLAIAELKDLLQYLRLSDDVALRAYAAPVQAYRDKYGV
jgi:orotate phosphoribosyltransferase